MTEPIDPSRFSVDNAAPVFVTRAHPASTTPDEALRNCVAWTGEVTLAGIVVHRVRVLAHMKSDPAHAIRHARETAAAGFATSLAALLGTAGQDDVGCAVNDWCKRNDNHRGECSGIPEPDSDRHVRQNLGGS